MKLERYYKTISESSQENKLFIQKNMDILDRIHFLLKKKFDGKQHLLAAKMGKSEAEVSRIINGLQNFTQKTIIKLEVAFGEPIQHIHASEYDDDTTCEYVAPFELLPPINLSVSVDGKMESVDKTLKDLNIAIS